MFRYGEACRYPLCGRLRNRVEAAVWRHAGTIQAAIPMTMQPSAIVTACAEPSLVGLEPIDVIAVSRNTSATCPGWQLLPRNKPPIAELGHQDA